MNQYQSFLADMFSPESSEKKDDQGDPQFATDPSLRESGEVMIELPWDESHDHKEFREITATFEAHGIPYKTRFWFPEASTEDSSDGKDTGKPVPGMNEAANSIFNGVHVPILDKTDDFRIVQLVRPEDAIKESNPNILYLMNSRGDIKDFLENEGHIVVDDAKALANILSKDEREKVEDQP